MTQAVRPAPRAISPERRPRAPAFVYVAIAVALLVLVSVMALTSRQPPPPTISEFAPQAIEQIQDAPNEQSSDFGSGAGECPPGAVCEPGGEGGSVAAAEPPPAIQVPRVRRCVGDPPRQIEDPQSPPCVPYWEGDNGGETWQGVTRDEILVAKPRGDIPDETIAAFFNKRFEFYGRKIRFIRTSDQGEEAQQRAAAVHADEVLKVFASLDSHDDHPYFAELASRQIVAVTGQSQFSEGDLNRWQPYVWQYPMSADRNFSALADMACARLAGRPAAHGDPRFAGSERVFGIIIHEEWSQFSDIDSRAIEEGLARCGASSKVTRAPGRETAAIRNAIIEMQSSGVTSVFCMCHIFANLDQYFAASTSQGYFPEWIVSTYVMLDSDPMLHLFANHRDQLAHTFGITVRPRQWPVDETPLWWAMKEMDPAWEERVASNFHFALHQYQAMLLLASGIQMAGPNLTPESFRRGLQQTRFPNPDHALMAGHVGFPRVQAMTMDAAEWWWSNSDRSPYPDLGSGTICYVEGGTRRTPGRWPAGADPFFSGPCDSGS